jgi:hypothetical protein
VVVVLAGVLRPKPPPPWVYAAVMMVAWGYALAQRAPITS